MNIIDPNNFTFPIAGVTGWRDRDEGPLWVRERRATWPRGLWPRPHTRVPFCVFSLNLSHLPRPGQVQNNPPCRHATGFPCCRWAQARSRRPSCDAGFRPW